MACFWERSPDNGCSLEPVTGEHPAAYAPVDRGRGKDDLHVPGGGPRGLYRGRSRTGEQGFSWLNAPSIEVVVLDWMLPGRHSIEILRALRAHGAKVPVLLLTARDPVEDRVRALQDGAGVYLVIPLPFAEPLARMRPPLRQSAQNELLQRCVGSPLLDVESRREWQDGEKEEDQGLIRHHLGWSLPDQPPPPTFTPHNSRCLVGTLGTVLDSPGVEDVVLTTGAVLEPHESGEWRHNIVADTRRDLPTREGRNTVAGYCYSTAASSGTDSILIALRPFRFLSTSGGGPYRFTMLSVRRWRKDGLDPEPLASGNAVRKTCHASATAG